MDCLNFWECDQADGAQRGSSDRKTFAERIRQRPFLSVTKSQQNCEFSTESKSPPCRKGATRMGQPRLLFGGQLDAFFENIHRYVRLLFGCDQGRRNADRARSAAEEQNAALERQLDHTVAGL